MERFTSAVVGVGYWGPNLARNLQITDDFELVALCDADGSRLRKLAEHYPSAHRFTSMTAMLAEAPPQLVAIATPVATHAALAIQALEAGCNVLVEKPLAGSVAEAQRVLETAARVGRRVFVDHTFLFTGAVRVMRDQLARGVLGSLYYVDSVRVNLGLFQPDIDVIWDLAPHDLTILQYVLGQKVRTVQATGKSHNPRKTVDVAYLTLEYENGLMAHLHLSWLSPVKVRRMILSGTQSSLIYDDIEPSEKVKIYDHGVSFDVRDVEARERVLVSYRRGDMRAPAIQHREALAVELDEIAAVLRGDVAHHDATGGDGLEIVRILEAATRSLEHDGQRVKL